jgi:hypothetical protein
MGLGGDNHGGVLMRPSSKRSPIPSDSQPNQDNDHSEEREVGNDKPPQQEKKFHG